MCGRLRPAAASPDQQFVSGIEHIQYAATPDRLIVTRLQSALTRSDQNKIIFGKSQRRPQRRIAAMPNPPEIHPRLNHPASIRINPPLKVTSARLINDRIHRSARGPANRSGVNKIRGCPLSTAAANAGIPQA